MAKSILFLLAFLSTLISIGQDFEGKVVYTNTYTSKIPGVSDEQFTSMMGTTQEYFIKDGNYKSVMNGSLMQWQIYVNSDVKLYNKMSNSEDIFWLDVTINTDEVLKTELNKGVIEILGYQCDELILTCKSGIQKFYFSPLLSADAKKFESHKLGNFYDFLSRANSIPLMSVIENDQFSIESIATEIKPMVLEQTIFELPENVKTVKSPF